jgi:hypothetical protein
MEDAHPAARWARAAALDPQQMDCITAVALQILDAKCQMNAGDQVAALAAYDAVRDRPGVLFGPPIHQTIEAARRRPTLDLLDQIHALRLRADARIPPTVMKQFQAMLRQGLYG